MRSISLCFIQLLVVISIAMGCGLFKKKSKNSDDSSGASVAEENSFDQLDPSDQAKVLRAEEPEFGLLNYEQSFDTMASLTGVDPDRTYNLAGQNNVNLRNIFRTQIRRSLPNATNDLKLIKSAHATSLLKLASAFCYVMFNYSETEFTKPYLETLELAGVGDQEFRDDNYEAIMENEQNFSLIAGSMIDRFWGTGLSTLPDRTEAIEELRTMRDAIAEGLRTGDSAGNLRAKNMGVGMCSAILAALPAQILR